MSRALCLLIVAASLAACTDPSGESPPGAGGAAGAGGSAGAGGGDETGPPWLESFSARRRIVFHPTLAEPLIDFTVPIVIQDDAHLLEHATTLAGFAFTDADGVTVRHLEVERYDEQSGSLVAWLRVPELVPDADRAGYLYYGHPEPTAVDGALAWREGTVAVWHLGEDPAVTASFADSTGGNEAQILNVPPTSAPGIAGTALAFANDNDLVGAGDPPDGSLHFGLASFSFSLWVHVTVSSGMYDSPLQKGSSCGGCDNGLGMYLGTGSWECQITAGGVPQVAGFGDEAAYLGRWVHLAAVVDRQHGEMRAYADGAPTTAGDISAAGTTSSGAPLAIGSFFNGVIDEVRIYDWPLDVTWIAAEHDSLTDPASFYTLAAPESR